MQARGWRANDRERKLLYKPYFLWFYIPIWNFIVICRNFIRVLKCGRALVSTRFSVLDNRFRLCVSFRPITISLMKPENGSNLLHHLWLWIGWILSLRTVCWILINTKELSRLCARIWLLWCYGIIRTYGSLLPFI